MPLRPWGRSWGLILSMLGGHWWVFKQDRDLSASSIEKPMSVLCGGQPAGAAVGAERPGGGSRLWWPWEAAVVMGVRGWI